MQRDMELIAETRAWLVRAKRDIDAGSFELTAPSPFTEDAVFHAQQAAEKAMKGFLAWHATTFRKTHLLEEIGEQCLRLDLTLKTVFDRAVPLTQFAWKYRYPGEPADPTVRQALEALEVAQEVYDAILDRLPEEARP